MRNIRKSVNPAVNNRLPVITRSKWSKFFGLYDDTFIHLIFINIIYKYRDMTKFVKN